jgi:hypothetical protein
MQANDFPNGHSFDGSGTESTGSHLHQSLRFAGSGGELGVFYKLASSPGEGSNLPEETPMEFQ